MARDEISTSAEEIPEMNEEIVKPLIHQKLDEIRSGDLFVHHDLKDDSVDDLLQDANLYKKFESIIGKTWMDIDMASNDEIGLNGGKLNRKKKMYTKALKGASDFVREQIEIYISTMHSKQGVEHGENGVTQVEEEEEETPLTGNASDDVSEEEDSVSSLSDGKISRSSSSQKRKKKKKSKKKKQKDKKKKKRKKRLSHESSEVDDDGGSLSGSILTEEDKRLRRRLGKAKAFFEKQRDDVMGRIPEDVKNDFRKVGFAKWGKEFLPVMQMSPYEVAPGGVRDQWMEMFHNTLKSKRPMTRLVFWYGTPEDDLSGGYSFVPCTKFFSCESGVENNHNVIPQKILKKIENGKRLTANERMLLKGLEQITADVKLEPSKRSPWLFAFEEEYDDYLMEIDDEISDEDEIIEPSIDSDKKTKQRKKKNQKEKSESDPTVKKQKRKRKSDEANQNKKSKKSKLLDKEIEQSSKNSEEIDEETKPLSKKTKRAKAQDQNKPLSSKKSKKSKQTAKDLKPSSKKSKKSLSLDEKIAQEVAEEDAMNFDAPSEDDEDDDDFCDKDDTESEEEEVELYEDPTFTKKKTVGKATSTKSKAKKQTLKSPEEIEQELFETCEKVFLPLMKKLQDADTEGNAEKLLKKIDRDVQKLTPSFFKTHQIGLVVKEVRSRFKDSTALNQMCKQITSKMKSIYRDKLGSEPKGFEPKMKKRKKIVRKNVECYEEEQVKTPTTVHVEEVISTLSRESSKQRLVISSAVSCKAAPTLKQEKVESISGPQMPPQKTPKSAKPKAKAPRKSFSLAGMIDRKPLPTPSSICTSEKKSEADAYRQSQALPEWTVNYQRTGDAFEINPDRIFAMEFLVDAVSCLPKVNVDPISIARAIEDALHTKYEHEHDQYMDRLHDICAAISGKNQMGYLAQKIANGDYATPMDVISIPRKLLFQSFEGFRIP